MKKYFCAAAALITTLLTLTSCLKDDETTDYSDSYECAITSFYLGDLSTSVTGTAKDGSDSIYTITTTGSNYKFHIDQLAGLIYNTDSLPYGTSTSKVTATIGANGYVAYYTNGDSLSSYSSDDSLNFSKPLTFRIFAYNGLAAKNYTVKVNVKTQKPGVMSWAKIESNYGGASLTSPKAIEMGGKIFVYGKTADGKVATTWTSNGRSWSPVAEILGTDESTSTSNIVSFKDNVYMLIGNTLYESTDGFAFRPTTSTLDRLIAASSNEISGVKDGKFVSSSNAADWTDATGDYAPQLLPSENISSVSFALRTNSNISKTILVGTNSTDNYAQVWGKLSGDAWFCYPQAYNPYTCPRFKNLAMMQYDGKLIAFGESCTYGTDVLGNFANVYTSADEGITWKPQSKITLPGELSGVSSEFAYIMSGDFIWLIFSESGDIWKGRLSGIETK